MSAVRIMNIIRNPVLISAAITAGIMLTFIVSQPQAQNAPLELTSGEYAGKSDKSYYIKIIRRKQTIHLDLDAGVYTFFYDALRLRCDENRSCSLHGGSGNSDSDNDSSGRRPQFIFKMETVDRFRCVLAPPEIFPGNAKPRPVIAKNTVFVRQTE